MRITVEESVRRKTKTRTDATIRDGPQDRTNYSTVSPFKHMNIN